MLTAEQIARRTDSIGSSDASAIVGLNPFRTAYDVFLEKTGRVEPFKGNAATEAGDLLEDAVVNHALKKLGAISHERAPGLMAAEGYGFITANLDCAAVLPEGERTIIEGKTSGITKMLNFEQWGDEWSADVPEIYQIQVQHQLFVAGPEYEFAILSALLPPRGFVLFCLPRQEDVIAALIERHIEFWECVRTDTPPEGVPSLEVAKRLRRTEGKAVPIPWELVANLQRATDEAKIAEQAKGAAQAKLIAALGDAEIGESELGRVTYFPVTVKAHHRKESTSRRLSIKPLKGNK